MGRINARRVMVSKTEGRSHLKDPGLGGSITVVSFLNDVTGRGLD
jgi:hypothetical protein